MSIKSVSRVAIACLASLALASGASAAGGIYENCDTGDVCNSGLECKVMNPYFSQCLCDYDVDSSIIGTKLWQACSADSDCACGAVCMYEQCLRPEWVPAAGRRLQNDGSYGGTDADAGGYGGYGGYGAAAKSSSDDLNKSELYEDCTGADTCAEGLQCKYMDPYYSQCLCDYMVDSSVSGAKLYESCRADSDCACGADCKYGQCMRY